MRIFGDKIGEIVHNIRNNKLRVLLTGLSVSWGIFMLILMKKTCSISIVILVSGIFIGTIFFLAQQSSPKTDAIRTVAPHTTDIVKKIVATGSVQPRKEIEIKPLVPGIISDIPVREGQSVKAGQIIATIRLTPNLIHVNEAEARLSKAQIALEDLAAGETGLPADLKGGGSAHRHRVFPSDQIATGGRRCQGSGIKTGRCPQNLYPGEKTLRPANHDGFFPPGQKARPGPVCGGP